MADDAPSSRTVPARGVLDLSTGPAAPPPPPAPRPPVTPDPDVRVGKALDLSRKAPSPQPKRASDSLGHGPVVRETIDLSTAKPPRAEPSPPSASAPRREEPAAKRGRSSGPPPRHSGPQDSGRSNKRGVAPKAASSSLADLLAPEVLARLRGNG